jgi:hypothetical protein
MYAITKQGEVLFGKMKAIFYFSKGVGELENEWSCQRQLISLVRNFAQNLKIKMKRNILLGDSFFFWGKIFEFCFFGGSISIHILGGGHFWHQVFMFWIGSRNISPFNVNCFWGEISHCSKKKNWSQIQ